MIIAQISDLHIKRKGKLLHHMVNTARALRRCIGAINRLQPRPDLILATGDLTESGKPKEYKRLRKILAEAEIPLYLIPGNHDHRERLREAFSDHTYLPASGYLHYTIEHRRLRMIGLDTTAAGYSGGELDDARLEWVDARLREAPRQPTIIFMHHPPFATGIPLIDARAFRGVERFLQIVRAHPQIARIVCGHIHRAMLTEWGGTIVSTAPSTAHQLVLEARARGVGLAFEAAGFSLHTLDAGGGLITQHRLVTGE